MKKILNIVLKNIGSLAVCILFLSANTTSGWIAHQPEVPQEIKKFKNI
ncbi:MAG: cyclic lactone autoinducer peptide [Paraclostridium sp.]